MSWFHVSPKLFVKSLLRPTLLQTVRPVHADLRFLVRAMASGGSSSDHQNRLAQEKSPYLLQHAANPVDWYPWGEEAFEKAKKEDKPIFLSVGYSTCHWCHVMERESFENADIGKIMNDNFVSIKVDREERPDVDRVYMTFVQATSGGGGWPMSVWLTPDLKPIVGGTYFPPHDRFGRPGFGTILQSLAKQWREQKGKMEMRSTAILDALSQATSATAEGESLPGSECFEKCYTQLTDSYDQDLGGFGSAPKFPQPVNFNFMFRLYGSSCASEQQGKLGLDMTLHTLRMMAKGGIHDHISQGFHRYSTDQYWHVPHFEKMLYDQGQLAVSYLDAYQITKEEIFAEVAKDILLYVSRDLSDKNGGFYSAEDADSFAATDSKDKTEGAFCVWTEEEVIRLLSEKVEGSDSVTLADIFCKHYSVSKGGNVDFEQDPHGELKNKNVLIVRGKLKDTANHVKLDQDVTERALAKSRQILYDQRQTRPKPHLDDKMLTAWNGLMISGFARGGQVLQDQQYTDRAIQAAQFIKDYLYNKESKCLLRSAYCDKAGGITQISKPINGFVDDYAFLIRGLLDLYEACYDQSWMQWACELQQKQDELFWDSVGNSGYFSGVGDDPSILLRMKEDQDGAEPSGNSVSALNLLRLSHFTDNSAWRERAEKIFTAFEDRLKKIPVALPEMVSALLFYKSTAKQVIIHGEKDAPDMLELQACIHSCYLPNKVLIHSCGDPSTFLSTKLSMLSTLEKKDGKATVYVCENYQCQLPVNTAEELKSLLKT